MNTGIYKIRNKLNNKIYYGSAIDIDDRWYKHKNSLNKNEHANIHLQLSWNRYGQNNFEFKILLLCNSLDLLYYEQLFLDKYFDDGATCYNICPIAGNMLGFKHSDETKEKMSKMKRNKHHSVETRHKIGAALVNNKHRQGKQHSTNTKNKMSKSQMGRKHSVDTIVKISKAHSGEYAYNAKLNWDIVKEIRDKYKTGNYTQLHLANEYNVDQTNISYIINNKKWVIA